MRIWFDTEFYENGRTIGLISIGMVREDGATFYGEADLAPELASQSEWLAQNVKPHLVGGKSAMSREALRARIVEFAGEKPEFWAYYADYDWVVLCQLFGTMMDLPKGWPMYCRDVQQLCDDLGGPSLPKQDTTEHNAMGDAIWTWQAWEYLQTFKRVNAAISSIAR